MQIKNNVLCVDAKTKYYLTRVENHWWQIQKFTDGKATADIRFYTSKTNCIRYGVPPAETPKN